MEFNVAIVEDSQDNIEILEYLLGKSEYDIHIKGIAKTISEAELLLSRPDIDLAFLDIQLKEGTIFNVLEKLQGHGNINFELVFVTAHGSYENAMKAIRFSCLSFINKPVDQAELNATLAKMAEKAPSKQGDEQVRHLLELMKGNPVSPATIGIILPKGVIEFVEVDDIRYIEADQTISRIMMRDGRNMNSARHLGYYIEILTDNDQFVQSSKSHLVNLNHIRQYDHRERTIRFDKGDHLVASFRFSKDLKKKLLERHKGGGMLDKLSSLFGKKS